MLPALLWHLAEKVKRFSPQMANVRKGLSTAVTKSRVLPQLLMLLVISRQWTSRIRMPRIRVSE